MANQLLTPPPQHDYSFRRTQEPELNLLLSPEKLDEPLWRSLARQVHDRLYPEKLPPLQLTSRPVKVKDIWGEYNYKKKGALGTTLVHAAVIGALIFVSIAGKKVVQKVQEQHVTLVAPDLSQLLPMSTKKNDTIGGGGGGGDRDKLVAPKGKLPKLAMEQITPPAMVIRNEHPKLEVQPTVVIPPQVKINPAANMPNFGDP